MKSLYYKFYKNKMYFWKSKCTKGLNKGGFWNLNLFKSFPCVVQQNFTENWKTVAEFLNFKPTSAFNFDLSHKNCQHFTSTQKTVRKSWRLFLLEWILNNKSYTYDNSKFSDVHVPTGTPSLPSRFFRSSSSFVFSLISPSSSDSSVAMFDDFLRR